MLLSFVLFGSRLRSGVLLSQFLPGWLLLGAFGGVFSLFGVVAPGLPFWVFWFGVLVLFGGVPALLCGVARFLGWLRFVRFPRPAVGWVCVPVARLSSLSVVAVRPAVVAVGSGVVSFVWCLLPQTLHK